MSHLRIRFAAFIQAPEDSFASAMLMISTLSFQYCHCVPVVLPVPANTKPPISFWSIRSSGAYNYTKAVLTQSHFHVRCIIRPSVKIITVSKMLKILVF